VGGPGIDPFFEDDAELVPIPPCEPTFANCLKIVERDVEIYRQNPEPVRIYPGAMLGDVVSDASVQFPGPAEEQPAVHRLFDHLQPIFSTSPRWLWHYKELHRRSGDDEDTAPSCTDNREPDLRLTRQFPDFSKKFAGATGKGIPGFFMARF
jgi:hypothetical protein